MARTRTANISGELITNTLFVTSTGANVSNAVVKTGDTMTGELNVANSLIVTGNVGIGTSLPSSKIQIDGNSDVSDEDCMLRIVDNDSTEGSQIPSIQFLGGASANQIGLLRVNDQLGFQFRNNANTTIVTFAQNGNIGIGTTSPSAKLDVIGAGAYNDTENGATFRFTSSANTSKAIWGGFDNSIDMGFIQATHRGVAHKSLLLNPNGGSVGVGTTSTTARLEVGVLAGNYIFDLTNSSEASFKLRTYNHGTGTVNAVAFTQGLYYTDTENASIRYYRGSSGSDGFLGLVTSGLERARITSTGRMGVGTTSIANLFQVSGAMGLNHSAMASSATDGDFTITLGGLSTLAGNAWQSAGLLVFYSGVDGDQTNSTLLVTALFLRGLSNWGLTSTNNIVGTASVSDSNATSTSLDITFNVSDSNYGSVFAIVIGGSYNGGSRPTISIS